MKSYFYPHSTYTSVLAFAEQFKDMSVRVYDTNTGEIVGVKLVPCSLTPREKIVSILKANNGNINDVDPQVDNYLPRITINMNGLTWAQDRMSGKYEKRLLNIEYDAGTHLRKMQIDVQPVPYNLNFEVVVWAKYMIDGMQLLEMIAPWFAPEDYVSYKERNFGIERKAKVILTGITTNHVYEFGEADRRVLQWTFSYTMESFMYKPMEEDPEILRSIISIADVPCKKLPFAGDKIVIYEPDTCDYNSQFERQTITGIYGLDAGESYDLMTKYWKSANNSMSSPDFVSCVEKNCEGFITSTASITGECYPAEPKPLIIIGTVATLTRNLCLETLSRIAGDAYLQSQISSLSGQVDINVASLSGDLLMEIIHRIDADTLLQSQITTISSSNLTEITGRVNADDLLQTYVEELSGTTIWLQTQLNSISANDPDLYLQAQITTISSAGLDEVTGRVGADLLLQNQITTISGNAITAISTNTLTNKRRQPRVYSTTSTALLIPEIDTYDIFHLTAQAVALSAGNHVTSTPADGEQIRIRILDNGVAQTIAFGSNYVAKAGVALPTTTTAGKNMEMGFEYNSNLGKFNLLALGVES